MGKLLREGSPDIKESFERLLAGDTLRCAIDEQIVYDQLERNESAVWSLLLASGYLKVQNYEDEGQLAESNTGGALYELTITNFETRRMFERMVTGWFNPAGTDYNDFIKALLSCDTKAMNRYMNRVALQTFSYFDTGSRPSEKNEPERFYHGFVLVTVKVLNSYETCRKDCGKRQGKNKKKGRIRERQIIWQNYIFATAQWEVPRRQTR